jgi:hypothetical protein
MSLLLRTFILLRTNYQTLLTKWIIIIFNDDATKDKSYQTSQTQTVERSYKMFQTSDYYWTQSHISLERIIKIMCCFRNLGCHQFRKSDICNSKQASHVEEINQLILFVYVQSGASRSLLTTRSKETNYRKDQELFNESCIFITRCRTWCCNLLKTWKIEIAVIFTSIR